MTGPVTSDASGDAQALAAFAEGKAAFAVRVLDAARRGFERAHRRSPRDPLIMSWYAVTLVLVERNSNLGMVLSEQALRLAPDAEVLLNAARLHLALKQRERAVRAITRGLELWPDDVRLRAARDAIGTRRAPVISFLSRNNPLNRILGRIRHRWNQRHVPEYQLTPVSLGVPIQAPGDDEGRS